MVQNIVGIDGSEFLDNRSYIKVIGTRSNGRFAQNQEFLRTKRISPTRRVKNRAGFTQWIPDWLAGAIKTISQTEAAVSRLINFAVTLRRFGKVFCIARFGAGLAGAGFAVGGISIFGIFLGAGRVRCGNEEIRGSARLDPSHWLPRKAYPEIRKAASRSVGGGGLLYFEVFMLAA